MRMRLFFCVLLLILLSACSAGEPETPPAAEPTSQAEPETRSEPESATSEENPSEEASEEEAAAATNRPLTDPATATDPPSQRSTAPSSPPTPPADPPADTGPHAGLLDPSLANETAPDQFRVKFETTKGDVILEINRAWAPRGADRFYNLVRTGFFNDIALFRVIKTPAPFMAQFGIHGDPRVSAAWDRARIQDDPVRESNTRGRITFATAGPNTRTTQLFINFADNSGLDRQGFAPIGEVIEGMDVVDSFYAGYGEGIPRGRGPSQGLLTQQGNAYLRQQYDRLDYIKSAVIVK